MKRTRSLRYYFIMGLLLILPLSACGPKYQAAKAQRQHEKRIEQRRKEGERAMRQARQRHVKAQSPETQRRMKENRRKSESLNNNRRSPFYVRWFNAIRRR